MSDYRLALDHTATALAIRARNFRNLVVAFVVIGLVSIGGVLAQFSLWPASGLLLLAPAYAVFLWRDSVILGRWRAQLCEVWVRCAIDFGALRAAMKANPALPQSTVEGMLDTLPATGDLMTEHAVPASAREAIARATLTRDASDIDARGFRAAALTIAATAIILAIMLSRWTPLFAFALLPALAIVWKWGRAIVWGRRSAP